MAPILASIISLLAVANTVAAASWNTTCTIKSQRKAWNNMTTTEKTAYIDAELCLMARPAQAGISGAQNRWDELTWAHIVQSNIVHNVGAFLPWHRYFMRTHEYLLQSECGCTGGQPYWNEVLDMGALKESIVFDPTTGFGGEGGKCVTDGPFANLTLRMSTTPTNNTYCLSRSFNQTEFRTGIQANVDECFNKTNYPDAWDCYQVNPHTAVHLGVGGTVRDVAASPGDPLFYLHHTYLDRLWWMWQQVNLTVRLTDMGGRNIPLDSFLAENNFTYPTASEIDYFGDGGNETTLNHNLWMVGILPNATIREVMDLGSNLNCAEYV